MKDHTKNMQDLDAKIQESNERLARLKRTDKEIQQRFEDLKKLKDGINRKNS